VPEQIDSDPVPVPDSPTRRWPATPSPKSRMSKEERVKRGEEAIARIARGFVETMRSVSDQRKTGEVVVRVSLPRGIHSQSLQVVDDMGAWLPQ